jgi:hypothetical protein
MCQFFLMAFSSLIGICTDFRKAGIAATQLMKWLPR